MDPGLLLMCRQTVCTDRVSAEKLEVISQQLAQQIQITSESNATSVGSYDANTLLLLRMSSILGSRTARKVPRTIVDMAARLSERPAGSNLANASGREDAGDKSSSTAAGPLTPGALDHATVAAADLQSDVVTNLQTNGDDRSLSGEISNGGVPAEWQALLESHSGPCASRGHSSGQVG